MSKTYLFLMQTHVPNTKTIVKFADVFLGALK